MKLSHVHVVKAVAAYQAGVSLEQSSAEIGCSERHLRRVILAQGLKLTRSPESPATVIGRAVQLLDSAAADLEAGCPDAAAYLQDASELARKASGALLTRFAEQLAEATASK